MSDHQTGCGCRGCLLEFAGGLPLICGVRKCPTEATCIDTLDGWPRLMCRVHGVFSEGVKGRPAPVVEKEFITGHGHGSSRGLRTDDGKYVRCRWPDINCAYTAQQAVEIGGTTLALCDTRTRQVTCHTTPTTTERTTS